MSAVTGLKPGTKLYVMETQMSSPFFTDRSENIDSENAKKLYYHFPAKDRRKIGAIRQQINVLKNASCARFYTLYIANDLAKEQLTEALENANREMKDIDSTLKAEAVFVELKTEALSSGNMLQVMTAQIQDQIYGVVLKRIEQTIKDNAERGGALTTKSKTALLAMLEKCKCINVIEDEDINTKIEKMKEQITSESLIPLRDEILSVLDNSGDRFSSIDIMPTEPDGEKVKEDEVTPETPVHDPDDEMYADTPVDIEPAKKNQSGSRIASRVSIDDL
jgi:hypothetical protein